MLIFGWFPSINWWGSVITGYLSWWMAAADVLLLRLQISFQIEVLYVTKWQSYLPLVEIPSRYIWRGLYSSQAHHIMSSGDPRVHSQIFFQRFLLGENYESWSAWPHLLDYSNSSHFYYSSPKAYPVLPVYFPPPHSHYILHYQKISWAQFYYFCQSC